MPKPTALRDLRDEKHELEMTPMIDVTFLLLIFFLCTIRFRTLEGKLAAYLPKDVGPTPAAADQIERLAIRVEVAVPGARLALDGAPWNGEGRFRFSDDRALTYRVGARATDSIDHLRARLAEQFAADPTRPLTLDAGPDTVYGDVVPVLDAVAEVGFQDLTFVGTYER